MTIRKKPDGEEQDAQASASKAEMVRVKITKFGHEKISTGEHIAGKGDVMARHGDILEAPADEARILEDRGLLEIMT